MEVTETDTLFLVGSSPRAGLEANVFILLIFEETDRWPCRHPDGEPAFQRYPFWRHWHRPRFWPGSKTSLGFWISS